MKYEPAEHYDRVTAAWTLLLGEELHYGVFRNGPDDLPAATNELTRLMIEAAQPDEGTELLDVGCGTGAPAAGSRATSAHGSPGSRRARPASRLRGRAPLPRPSRICSPSSTATGWTTASRTSRSTAPGARVIPPDAQPRPADGRCARVLRPGGRLALCDIVLRREMDLQDVRRLRELLALLRDVFGDARMEQLPVYRELAADNGLEVEQELDLTADTRPTFAAWRANAEQNRDEVVGSIGEDGWQQFVDSCGVLEGFWDDGTLGYGLIAAVKPG